MTSVLLSGGAGFVGRAILDSCLEKHPGWSITVIDSKPAPAELLHRSGVAYIRADITAADEVAKAFARARPDVVVHTAGWVPQGKERHRRVEEGITLKINVDGTANMLDAARRSGARAFVFTSSCTVITEDQKTAYPNYSEDVPVPPRSLIYGESKALAEQLVLAANSAALRTCALRPSVILGPGDYQLIPAIHACIAKGETPFVLGDGDNLYDFTYVTNVADAHLLAVEDLLSGAPAAAGHAINISNGQPVTFRDFMLAVWAQFGHVPPFVVRIPASVAWVVGLVVEVLSSACGLPATLNRGAVLDAVGTRYADVGKARDLLGYEPRVDLWDGVRMACDDLKERLREKGKAG